MQHPMKFVNTFLSIAFLFLVIVPVNSQHQIVIDSVKGPGRDALIIKYAERDGVRVSGAGRAGFLSENGNNWIHC